ncbi:MAG: hydroxymethylglutaryl-CoA lyase [Rhodobacteraceae bacterium]|nr:hydroxymethylglutaryl-CoA lyase [Paracoccaceae bacterium]
MSKRVRIIEVGPRDGLQNEAETIPTGRKIRLVDTLADCGLKQIEVTGFVSPRWVPQLADAAEVMSGINRPPGTCFSVLIPNLEGMKRAIRCAPDAVAVLTSASEGFCQRNINCSIAESLNRIRSVLAFAGDRKMLVRAYISNVIECPYDGRVAPAQVARLAHTLLTLGCDEISLGDTIGAGTPDRVDAMLAAVLEAVPVTRLAGHYHNTNGRALDSIKVSLARGLRAFDSAAGGLGGCPFAPGAQGNVATEQVVQALHEEGYETGIDLEHLTSVAAPLAHGMRSQQ